MIDYLDGDVAYLLGLLVARGEISESENVHRMVVHFPKGDLLAQGENVQFDTDKEIRLGIEKIRERLLELLGSDVRTLETGDSWDLIIRSTRNTIAWRDIRLLMGPGTSFPMFDVPDILFDEGTDPVVKREFIRGFADAAGNIRPANRNQAGRHRLRLDVLNYPTNWATPVRLCLLLQEHLNVPVTHIRWGHPNLGSHWREHQVSVYPEDFLQVGFSFEFKQAVLEDLANVNLKRFAPSVKGCPGVRKHGATKPASPEENNGERLPGELLGNHYDAYWQICKALGCPRKPVPGEQLDLIPED
jgi:hypothetical protein